MALPVSEILKVGEYSISYRQRGEGDVLFFVHGMGCGSANWESQYDYFSERYRVVGWDAPGYGQSSQFDTDLPSVADYAMLMADFLDELGVQRIHLVGHSYGGIMVAAFHRAFTDRVLSLTLAQPVIGGGINNPKDREKEIRERVAQIKEIGMKNYAAKLVPHSCAPNALPEALSKGIELTSGMSQEGYLRQFRSLKHANIFEWTSEIKIPSLIVSGEFDKTASREMVSEISEEMTGIRHKTIKGIGHMIYLEYPERFNALLEDLLEESS